MSIQTSSPIEEEPELSPAQRMAEKLSRGFLYGMGIVIVALFPAGLVYKAIVYLFS